MQKFAPQVLKLDGHIMKPHVAADDVHRLLHIIHTAGSVDSAPAPCHSQMHLVDWNGIMSRPLQTHLDSEPTVIHWDNQSVIGKLCGHGVTLVEEESVLFCSVLFPYFAQRGQCPYNNSNNNDNFLLLLLLC